MRHAKPDPLQQLKFEADELLFADLQFEHVLKERVMQHIDTQELRMPSEEQADRVSDRGWMRKRRQWILGTVAAAVLVCTIVIATPFLQQPDRLATVELPGMFGAMESEGPISALSDPLTESFGTIGRDGQPEGSGHPSEEMGHPTEDTGHLTTEIELQHLEEAASYFGNQLFVATYAPEYFQIKGIYASVVSEGEADKVAFRYEHESFSYDIIQEKRDAPVVLPHDEIVDINGVQGFMSATSPDSIRLDWFVGGVQYSVTGKISREEALRVAETMGTD